MLKFFIHREVLMVKIFPIELKSFLDVGVYMVNFIKSRALKTKLLKHVSLEEDIKYDTLVLHTEIRWLSKGKVLRFYELRKELLSLFNTEKLDLAAYLNKTGWCAKVCNILG